ncbi:MAG: hypothetical protein M5Z89_01240, partial [Olivibacter sp.]|nr:hypothetical protein [Olivibacter sp. UJ_SKK_5.1]
AHKFYVPALRICDIEAKSNESFSIFSQKQEISCVNLGINPSVTFYFISHLCATEIKAYLWTNIMAKLSKW